MNFISFSDQRLHLISLAALGLFAIQLALFAINSPFSGSSGDDWGYMYLPQLANARTEIVGITNRPIYSPFLLFDRFLFAGRFQAMFYFHIFCVYATSLGLFYVLWRMIPGHAWFAFIYSAVYLAYIPTNLSHPTYQLVHGSWHLFLTVMVVAVAIEFATGRGAEAWVALFVALVLSYVVGRGVELLIPLLAIVTPLIWIYFSRGFSRRIVAGILLLGVVLVVATLQFAVPYLSDDPSAWYQNRTQSSGVNLPQLARVTVEYFRVAFPSPEFLSETQYDYPPAIMVAALVGIVSWLYWRRFPGECKLPTVRELILLSLIGLGIVMLTGSGYIYANFIEEPRTQFFSAPGHALILVSFISLLGYGGSHFLLVNSNYVIGAFLAIYFVAGGQWFYHYDQYWDDTENVRIPFDKHVDFYNEVVALLPNIKDDTLILMTDCQIWGTTPILTFAAVTNEHQRIFATRYLYGMAWDSGVQLTNLERMDFGLAGLEFYDRAWDNVPPQVYGFDQMIVLRCVGDHLEIASDFPTGYTHPDAAIHNYNPYARIIGGFIPANNQRILAR